MSIQGWIAAARLAAMPTLLILALSMAQEAQASDASAAARPAQGVWQGQLGNKRIYLCVEANRSLYRYAGRAQSLELVMGADGWVESVDGTTTGRWQPSRVHNRVTGNWTDPKGARRLKFELLLLASGPQACSRPDYLQDALTESAAPMPVLHIAACPRNAAGTACIATRQDSAAVIRPDGSLWEWGPGTRRVPVRRGADYVLLRLAEYHSLAIKADGSLWGWGGNSGGQLGGDGVNGETPVKLGDGFVDAAGSERISYGLKRDGTVWAWGGAPSQGKFYDGSPYRKDKPFLVARGVIALAASSENVSLIKADGSMWSSWGTDGRPSEEGVVLALVGQGYRQVSMGYSHVAALKSDGSLWTWGSNRWGALGVGGPQDDRHEPAKVGDGFQQVSAGFAHTAAIKTDGSLWAWGGGIQPRALFGDCDTATHPLPVKLGDGFVEVSTGDDFLLATQADGSQWTWGWAWDDAQVEVAEACRKPTRVAFGDGISRWDAPVRAIPFPAPTTPNAGVISIATGPTHSAAVTADGALWTWGSNANGQLGNGSVTAHEVPTLVGTGYRSVFIDRDFTFAQKADGSVWRFGLVVETLTKPQLAAAKREGKIAPARVADGAVQVLRYGRDRAMGLRADGSLVDWGYHWDATRGPGTPMGQQVQAITASESGGVALRQDGSVWQLGHYYSQVPRLLGLDFIRFVSTGNQAYGIKRDGSLWARGDNSFGQLGNGSSEAAIHERFVKVGSDFSEVSAGEAHALALKRDGTLWAWGRNRSGAVGDGSTEQRAVPVFIGKGFVQIAAAGDHSLALKADGTLWAWGHNAAGELGDGSLQMRLRPVLVALRPPS